MSKTKDFFSYFWQTIKKAKYLIIKGVVIAILYTVISVLANLLEVKELTYLNALLALNYFASMISFGVSQGTKILVNQNISIKQRVEKSVKIGFELTLILSILTTALLVLFPKFIMVGVMGYTPANYTFYYLMCVYFFLTCIYGYLEKSLEQLDMFKPIFISNSVSLTFLIVSFLLLYLIGEYLLTYIAIAYIISAVILCAVYYILLYKKSDQKINVLKFTTITLTKRQWVIILSNFLTEIIWEVGYYATSVFMMRMGDTLFNSYSYLENVLDIFNSILLTVLVVISLDITRALGEDKFDRAKYIAKNSLLITLFLWGFYAVCSLIFIYPIALGINDQYFSAMFTILPCYILIHLFRFFTWNFSSYMLRLGGKENLPALIMEIFSTVWLIVLCFISKFIPNNTFLVYFLITLPDIITLPILFYLYKRGKWLNNLRKDPNLLSNKIKCFIFDFDDTLYYNIDWTQWNNLIRNWTREYFSNYTEEEYKILLQDSLGKSQIEKSEDIVRLLIKTEGSAKTYLNFREENDEKLSDEAKNAIIVPNSELEKFASQCKRQNGKMIIVSNNTLQGINAFAKYHNIELKLFDDILVNKYPTVDFSKKHLYEEVLKKYDFLPSEVLVIGNNFKSDLLPAKSLKMHTFLCKDGFTYEEVVN